VLCLTLAACATPQTDLLRRQVNDIGVPRHADVANAPFFPQRTNECGPAALAMLMAASGLPADHGELVREVYTPGREGSLAPELLTAARRHGGLAYRVLGLRDLFHQVAAGTPVAVLQNLSLPILPQWHYAVVVGYDLDEGTVTLHSGTTPRLKMPMETFERTWERGDYWALVVLEPGALPAHPNQDRYLEAAIGLERAKQYSAAQAAYLAGTDTWPQSQPLAMGLGNMLFALNRPSAAADVFEEITSTHPRAADAFNNLAHVRLHLGEIDQAERAARRAVALGGRNLDLYTRTLASILARKRSEASRR
jgi:hypothetical protein